MYVIVQMKPFERDMHGVAPTARGPKLAGCCPHPTGDDLRHVRVAYPPAPLQGPSPGLLRPRSGQTAGDAFGRGSGTSLARNSGQARHRPVSALARHARLNAAGSQPAHHRWLAGKIIPRGEQDHPRGSKNPPAEPRWQPPPLIRCPTLGQRLRGIPSHLARTVRDPSGSGSAASMTWGWRVWKRLWGSGFDVSMRLTANYERSLN